MARTGLHIQRIAMLILFGGLTTVAVAIYFAIETRPQLHLPAPVAIVAATVVTMGIGAGVMVVNALMRSSLLSISLNQLDDETRRAREFFYRADREGWPTKRVFNQTPTLAVQIANNQWIVHRTLESFAKRLGAQIQDSVPRCHGQFRLVRFYESIPEEVLDGWACAEANLKLQGRSTEAPWTSEDAIDAIVLNYLRYEWAENPKWIETSSRARSAFDKAKPRIFLATTRTVALREFKKSAMEGHFLDKRSVSETKSRRVHAVEEEEQKLHSPPVGAL